MVVQQQAGPLWTVGRDLVLERYSAVKHAYHGDYVYAPAGGAQAHSQIAGHVYALLRTGVRGSGCRALNPAIKICQAPDDYVYPDAVVMGDPRADVPGRDWIDDPTLVVEVLSPATGRRDRGDKVAGDRSIPTRREHALVACRQREVEVWRRGDTGAWSSTTDGPGDDVALTSVALTRPPDPICEDSGL